jgi:DNA-binding response OmpR family regulator
MKVLVVEDEPNLRHLYYKILKGNHVVHCCSNAREAFAEYMEKKGQYDLVVVDHRLPERAGTTLIHDIKSFNAQQKIVVVSGWTNEVKMPESFDVQVFSKPLSSEELCMIVEMYSEA